MPSCVGDRPELLEALHRPPAQRAEVPVGHVQDLAAAIGRVGDQLGRGPAARRSADRAGEAGAKVGTRRTGRAPAPAPPGRGRLLEPSGLQPQGQGRQPHAFVEELGARPATFAVATGRPPIGQDRGVMQRYELPAAVEDGAARRAGLGVADVVQDHAVGLDDLVVAQGDLLGPPAGVLDDVDDLPRAEPRDRAIQRDRLAPFQPRHAAEGEVEVHLGHEQPVGLQHHLDVALGGPVGRARATGPRNRPPPPTGPPSPRRAGRGDSSAARRPRLGSPSRTRRRPGGSSPRRGRPGPRCGGSGRAGGCSRRRSLLETRARAGRVTAGGVVGSPRGAWSSLRKRPLRGKVSGEVGVGMVRISRGDRGAWTAPWSVVGLSDADDARAAAGLPPITIATWSQDHVCNRKTRRGIPSPRGFVVAARRSDRGRRGS